MPRALTNISGSRPYVTNYSTLSLLKDKVSTNQQQLKMKQSSRNVIGLRDWSIRHRLKLEVPSNLLRTV